MFRTYHTSLEPGKSQTGVESWVRATKGHLRLTIGYHKATVVHIRVTLGHLSVTIGNFFLSFTPK